MKYSTRGIITIPIITLLILTFVLVLPYHNTLGYSGTGSWDQYQGDFYHDGFSSYPGPVTPGILWNATAPGDLGVVAGDGLIVIAGTTGQGEAFNPNNGTLVQQYGYDYWTNFPAIIGTTLVKPYDQWSVFRIGFLDIIHGDQIACYRSSLPQVETCFLATPNLLYISQENNNVIIYINPDSASLVGRIITESPVATNPVYGDGFVLVPLENGSVVAFNNGFNTSVWELNLMSPASSSPSYGDGSFYVATSNNLLYSISPRGSVNWFYTLRSQGLTPAVGLGKVFVGTIVGELYALTIQGNLAWETNTSSPITTPPVIASNGVVYVGTSDGEIYAFNTTNGREIWNWTLPNQVSSLALYDGNLYAITSAGQLYAFTNEQRVTFIETGLPSETLWSVTVNNKTKSSTNSTIVFDLPNGIFNYTVHKVNGYSSNVSFGILEVKGQNLRVEIGFSPGWSVPSPPLDVRAAGQANSILISWSPPQYDGAPAGFIGNAISYYYVYRGTSPDNLTFYARVPGNMTSMADYAVNDGIVYYYAVAAVNEAGVGSLSQIVSATPLLVSVPSPPQNLSIDVGSNFIKLTWKPPASTGGSPITNYVIYEGSSPHDMKMLVALSPNQTYYVDYQVIEGSTYYFEVVAVNSEGYSSPSNVVSGTPNGGLPTIMSEFYYEFLIWITDPGANPNSLVNFIGLISLPLFYIDIKSLKNDKISKTLGKAIAIILIFFIILLIISLITLALHI
ncbi:outer membrane protein assembly factor BamB family protein [Saccharolobus islandicus]|uniref:outer membrane protein assembly factor BamB family protein n=1 Tax=Saccharolobus islandicus TaxID=43080 RepID=UPI00037AE8C4|nr:PQQ-binding-like beta-propeller repeat protein [Sulfolobus islandicus]